MIFPVRIFLLLIPVACMLSCSGQKKSAGTKNNTKKLNIACGKVAVAAGKAHIDWFEADKAVLSSLQEVQLPKAYRAYLVEQTQLKRFFEAANAEETQTAVPLPSPVGCMVFTLKRSAAMSGSLSKKYPDMVSLGGTGANGSDIRLDFDGEKMSGQVIHKSETYIISSLVQGETTYYLIYRKSDSGVEKQPFESPDKR